ncbi:MAG: ABC transporter substrate-binding protein [Desulfitobacteriaceae bacterium]
MNRPKKTLIYLMSVILILTLSVVGCGSSSASSKNDNNGSKVVKVSAQAWMIDKFHLKQAADDFMAKNPGVQVEIEPYADNQVLSNFALQWIQNKSATDIVIVDGASTAVQFLAKDLIVDFNKTNFFQGTTAKENFVGESLVFTSVDGIQFALPYGLEAYDISANKKYFKEAGLTDAQGNIIPPKTWQDVYEYAKKMTKKEGNKVVRPGMTIQWGPNALSSMIAVEQAIRGSFYKPDGKTLTFDTPEMRDIFKIWKQGVDEGVFSIDTFTNKDAGRNSFNAGQVPMIFETAAHVPEAMPTIGQENSVVLAVPGSTKNGSYGFAAGIIVPKASKNQDLALKFVREGLMTDVQVGVATQWGKLPVIKNYFDKINADWKTEMYNLVKISKTAPMYRDLPKLQIFGQKQLQEYLIGHEDLNTFVANLEKSIADADKNTR